MPMYLKSGAEIVAELGPELPRSDANTRSWPLQPTQAFEHVRPAIAAFNVIQRAPITGVPAAIARIPDEHERDLAIQSWIRTNPAAHTRRHVNEQFRGLELLLTDEAGVPLPGCAVIGVAEVPPASVAFASAMRSHFEEFGFAGGPPFYMAVASVTPSPPGPPIE